MNIATSPPSSLGKTSRTPAVSWGEDTGVGWQHLLQESGVKHSAAPGKAHVGPEFID